MGHLGLIPGLGKPPGEGKVNPLQFWPGEFHGLYSLWGRKESEMTEQISLSLIMKSNQILQKLGKLFFTSSEIWGLGFRNKRKTISENIIRFGYINKTICKKKLISQSQTYELCLL